MNYYVVRARSYARTCTYALVPLLVPAGRRVPLAARPWASEEEDVLRSLSSCREAVSLFEQMVQAQDGAHVSPVAEVLHIAEVMR